MKNYRKKALAEAVNQAGLAIRIKLMNKAKSKQPVPEIEIESESEGVEPEAKGLSEDELDLLEKYLK